jgi:hypothetical protein
MPDPAFQAVTAPARQESRPRRDERRRRNLPALIARGEGSFSARLAGHGRWRAGRAPDPARDHIRPGGALRTAAPWRRGARSAEATGGPGAPAEGRGLVVQGDLPDHELDLHEGQSLLVRERLGTELASH